MPTDLENPIEQAIRDALAPPERLTVGQWAERNLRLSPKVTNYAGPFRLKLTPYLAGIFEAFQDPRIETIYLCFGGQTAKTTGMLVCLLYTVDQDPGPALWAMPTETLARSFSQNRIQPLVDETPALMREKPSDLDRYKVLEMQFRRSTLNIVGANSPSNLSSRPIRYLFADEVDKFPIESAREGSALHLALRRTAAYWNRKIVISSTPGMADGQIWQGLLSGDWREYHVPCPRCGKPQVLTFHGIRKPEGLEDPEEIRGTSWYECSVCAGRIENHEKPAMLEAGQWRAKLEPVAQWEWAPPSPGGRVASFHLPSWYAMWTPFGEILARFVSAAHYPEVLREVVNQDLAEPWEERGESRREEDILEHRTEYSDGTLPAGAPVIAVFLTVDVQEGQLYYVARAWGPFEESWLASAGVVPDFGALAMILGRDYSGYPMRIGFVDSGDRTDEVYEFCRMHPGCLPLKGVGAGQAPVRWSTIDRFPDGRPLVGGLRLMLLDKDHFRSSLFRRLSIKRGDPGYWHLNADIHEDYARQLVAEILVERRDTKGRIHREWKQVRRDNHYLDCFDDATQILTRGGWKNFTDLSSHDEMATINLSTDQLEYQRAFARIRKRYSGKMIRFEGRRLDLLVTPGHRMVVYRKTMKNGKWDLSGDPLRIAEAGALDRWDRIKLFAHWKGTDEATVLAGKLGVEVGDLAEFFGWYVSEGHSTQILKSEKVRSTQRRVVISQRKPPNRAILRALVRRLPWSFFECDQGFVCSRKALYEMTAPLGNGYSMRVPQWLKNASPPVIGRFLDAAILGDGWVQKGHRVYATTSPRLADDMQELFFKAGKSASIREVQPAPCRMRGKEYKTVKQFWVFELSTPAAHLRNSQGKPNFSTIEYEGNIWCVSVPNGTLIVRRNGRMCITGNCELYQLAAAWALGVRYAKTGPALPRPDAQVPAPMTSAQERSDKWKPTRFKV